MMTLADLECSQKMVQHLVTSRTEAFLLPVPLATLSYCFTFYGDEDEVTKHTLELISTHNSNQSVLAYYISYSASSIEYAIVNVFSISILSRRYAAEYALSTLIKFLSRKDNCTSLQGIPNIYLLSSRNIF